MRAVIADVAEYATAEDGGRGVPVIPEDSVCEFVEGNGEHDEEGGRHDEAVFVHG